MWRNAHQPDNRQRQLIAAVADKVVDLQRRHAGFLRLFSRIDLDEARRGPRVFVTQRHRQPRRQFRPVDAFDHVEQRHRLRHLVGLQRPDQVQHEVGPGRPPRRPPRHRLLHPVLAEHPLPGGQCRVDPRRRLLLADRDQGHRTGVTPGAPRRRRDALLYRPQRRRNPAAVVLKACYHRAAMNFADIIAPIGEETFFAEYHDRKPVHIQASDPNRFRDVMSWPALTGLLNMTAYWNHKNLGLTLDTEPISPAEYCQATLDPGFQDQLQPDPDRVTAWLRRGASLVANDIDSLTPGLAATADALEQRLGAKVQANLYCSTHRRQAFDTHFDTHEVFALHVEGEKVWRVYEGRLDQPIASAAFKSLGPDDHAARRGPVLFEATMRPGDVLYIPRGQYHDALASGDNALHVAFGATHLIGVDVVEMVLAGAMEDPAFRANLPLPAAGDAALRAHLADLAERLGRIANAEPFFAAVQQTRRGWAYKRGGYDLPGNTRADRFTCRAKGLAVVPHNGRHVLRGSQSAVAIPDGLEEMVAWMVGRPGFTRVDLDTAFAAVAPEQRHRAITAMAAMKVIEPEA